MSDTPCDTCEAVEFCRAEHQPFGIEVVTEGGIFVKEMHIPDAGTTVPQHSHTYAHTSFLASGAVRAWADGALLGDFAAPRAIQIPALVKHRFQSLVDNTTILCIHTMHDDGAVPIHAEHHIVREG